MSRNRYAGKVGWRWASVTFGAMLLLMPATGAAGRVIERDHYSGTESGEERVCGRRFHFELSFSGLFMLKTRDKEPTPYLFNNYRFRDVHTDDQGDGFIIQANGLFKDLRITHVRGTIYRFVSIEAGQPFSIRALDGTVVLRDRGLLKTTLLVDTKGDANLDNDKFIDGSFRVLLDAGRHPGFYLSEEEFCAAVNEAMGL
jgi:hypothetical protein